jgi:hypothetical protein
MRIVKTARFTTRSRWFDIVQAGSQCHDVMQVTVRNVSSKLAAALKRAARERGLSVNATVLELLEKAVGLDARRERLERYVSWDADDLAQFQRALAEQRRVEPQDWR